jgi:hypothetical protein
LDIGFIDDLHKSLLTATNYSAALNLHTLQIITVHTKLFKPAVSSRAIPWKRFLTVEILQLPSLRSYCHSRPCRTVTNSLNCQIPELDYGAISPQLFLQSSTLECQPSTLSQTPSVRLGFSFYSLGANPTEITVP